LHTALQSNPKLLRAHYNLANIWLQKGDIDQAIINYQQELQIQPQFAEGHNNLASALFRKGRLDEAQEHLRAALELNPNNPDAHNNLGIAFSQRGDMPQAIAQWNKTLEIQPDNLEAQCNLAWIFATFPDPSIRNGAKAVVLAERALQLSDRKSARIWRLAAAAYAEAGEFADAIKAAQNGLALAQAGNDAALAQTLQANIQQFENNRPLRDMGGAATPSR
jgi:Flp pilus assembly protein TadD